MKPLSEIVVSEYEATRQALQLNHTDFQKLINGTFTAKEQAIWMPIIEQVSKKLLEKKKNE